MTKSPRLSSLVRRLPIAGILSISASRQMKLSRSCRRESASHQSRNSESSEPGLAAEERMCFAEQCQRDAEPNHWAGHLEFGTKRIGSRNRRLASVIVLHLENCRGRIFGYATSYAQAKSMSWLLVRGGRKRGISGVAMLSR